MKISNNINVTSSLITQNDVKNQRENMQTGVKRMTEQPVKLSISDEGQEYYRNSIQQNQQETYDDVVQRKEQLKKVSFIDYGYEIQKKAAQQNEAADRSVLSTTDKANSYVKAYAELYDEIVQGYENGTREIYTTDENGTHKLTKDEELSALDAAYKKTADDFVTMEKTNQHASEIISGEMEKISKLSSRSTLASIYLEEQKTKGTDDIPENLNEKMYNAILSFKEKYAMFNPNTDKLSQLLMSVKIS
jgi:hypothetical protein